ncbi:MAG TPA: hypothetical protein PK239_11220 [Chitinophagales bacterium]|nr:hypothetical protein [Chitinophagales bacterium]
MRNSVLRKIGFGIVATLVLLFVLPAILRLLIVAAIAVMVFRIFGAAYLYKQRYRQFERAAYSGNWQPLQPPNFTQPAHTWQEPVQTIKIG